MYYYPTDSVLFLNSESICYVARTVHIFGGREGKRLKLTCGHMDIYMQKCGLLLCSQSLDGISPVLSISFDVDVPAWKVGGSLLFMR